MADKWIVPPFSVLDTRKKDWVERRRRWNEIIGDNGETRENKLKGFSRLGGDDSYENSLLDAVMAEVIVKWFGFNGGNAFDPFAGDTVFGYVASSCGMSFQGIELRAEQAQINNDRCSSLDAVYYCDTSENMDEYIDDNSIDLMFSCPPYFNLERYSDLPEALSNMDWQEFKTIYRNVLYNSFRKIKDNRFSVIVVGEVRGNDGNYVGLVPYTIKVMEDAGFSYYNEIIIVNSCGTLPLRAGRYMEASRKVGKMHQNILVFIKGNAKAAI